MRRVDTLYTRHDLAWAMGRLGRWAEAEHELRQVLREYRTHRQRQGQDRDDAFILHTRCKLCWCIGKQGRWDTAKQDYRLLLTDRAAILGPDHPDTLDTRESLGKTLAWQGEWADAETEFHALATGRRAALGEQHPDTLLAHQLETYAAGYQARLRHDRRAQRAAISQLEQILPRQEFVRGAEHRNTRDCHAFLAALRGTYSPDMPWTDDLPSPRD
ncbi:MAG: tetratricopeptide repeat protein, partial [Actinomycetota bacterium]|nr:tetratricopeptide repeat protein [Actinomycetota bacterium]